MNNNYEINRFYNLIKKLPPPGFPSKAVYRRHYLIRRSGQDRHRRANSDALKITAPRRAPSRANPARPFSEAGRSIDRIDWKDANNELDR
jgi:hypothetical protein